MVDTPSLSHLVHSYYVMRIERLHYISAALDIGGVISYLPTFAIIFLFTRLLRVGQ
jgi:hypothetical protein